MASKPIGIGLDFDNTIVCYDDAIKILAEEMLTLPRELPRTKLCLRNFLRDAGREPEWTEFQGALYGPGMQYAKPFDGAIDTMQALAQQGHQLTIVSHRSRRPYAGPAYDLHSTAMGWVEVHLRSAGLFTCDGSDGLKDSGVNFLETVQAKVSRVAELTCKVFVDDLPDVLNDPGFPDCTIGVLFAPGGQKDDGLSHHRISAWSELPALLAGLT
jgi:hypothetical protein